LLVYGSAECYWTETHYANKRGNQTTHFRGEEIYLNQRTYLFGHKGADAIEVQPGTHRYEFACQLPPMLPGSFEAKHGRVSYRIKAVLDIPWGFDKESTLLFTVVSHDDLNLDPALKIPCHCEEIKRFCCCFCLSDPLIMTVTLSKTGFVPGEVIPVKIVFKNTSSTDIDATRMSLSRHIRYNSNTPRSKTKHEHEKLIQSQFGGCKRGQQKPYQCNLTLPSTLLKSNAKICRVVQVSYEVKIEAVASGCCSNNIVFRIPITIGSIPLDLNPPVPMQAYAQQNQIKTAPSSQLMPASAPLLDLRKKMTFMVT
jgi:Arrestin (or S-antigen), C-terminal domain/Arrestin (or S-antigen), N-terminal domain